MSGGWSAFESAIIEAIIDRVTGTAWDAQKALIGIFADFFL